MNCGFCHKIEQDYDDWETDVQFRVHKIEMYAGSGTHIDVPSHCVSGGKCVESLSLEELITPCVVIDVSNKATEFYEVFSFDISDFESNYGKIQNGVFVVIRT